jgi:hypothetical protein
MNLLTHQAKMLLLTGILLKLSKLAISKRIYKHKMSRKCSIVHRYKLIESVITQILRQLILKSKKFFTDVF